VDVLEQYGGAAFIVAGFAMWSIPLALIVGGLMFAIHGFLHELKRINEKEQADGSRQSDQVNDPTRNP